MKQIIIIGGRNFGQTSFVSAFEKALEKLGPEVMTYDDVKKYQENHISGKEYYDINCFNEPISIHDPIFDKPKSKYHK